MALGISYDNPGLPVTYTLDSDPTTFAGWGGTNAEIGSILYRTDVQSIYRKTAGTATGWTAMTVPADAINVKAYGVKGDGITDDTAALQAVINQFPGRTLYLEKGGYKVTSTLFITTTCTVLVGDYAARASNNGTQIQYYGTGPCIQIGVDNGHSWLAPDYDGPQDQRFENFAISQMTPDTPLAAAGGAVQVKTGAYGIWDWRGGGMRFTNLLIEHFEAGFVGINSDISEMEFVTVLYSNYGVYLGPRSDQVRLISPYSFFCDRAVTIDCANQPVIYGGIFAFCGTDVASAIEVRRGSSRVVIHGTWFENSGAGFVAGNVQSCVSAGEVNGYGPGGSIQSPGGTPTTTAVAGCNVECPLAYPLPPGPGHLKCIGSVGKCNQFVLREPAAYIGIGLSTLDALVLIPVGQTPTTTDTQVSVYDPPFGLSRTQMFQNLGGGWAGGVAMLQPAQTIDQVTLGLDTTAVQTVRGAINHSAPTNANAFTTTSSVASQTVAVALWKLLANGSYDTTAGALFPVGLQIQQLATRSAGAASLGQTALSLDCAGAQSNTALSTSRGDIFLNNTSGITALLRGFYLNNQVFPAAIAADQTDYNPTGLTDACFLGLTSSASVLINSIAIDVTLAFGRVVLVRNLNASGSGLNITLVNEAGVGTATRRFSCTGYANIVLAPGEWATLYYVGGTLNRVGASKP